MKENETIDITDKTPTKTFHSARYRALGLYFEITKPAISKPKAEAKRANVPVKRLDADDDCRYKVSISFGEKIQNGMKL